MLCCGDQMWFAALGSTGDWFSSLLRRIVEGSPDVSALLDTDALHKTFKGRLPAVVRVSEYRYFFASPSGPAAAGALSEHSGSWWRRELVSQSQPISGVLKSLRSASVLR